LFCRENNFLNIIEDLDIICDVAADIANCAQRQLGDCVAEKVDQFQY
jgi:hypothetical protein